MKHFPSLTVVALGLACALFIVSCSMDTGLTEPELTDNIGMTAPSFNIAGAGPPLLGSGTWSIIDIELISIRVVGNNTIIENRVEIEWDGTLEGTSVHFNRIVVYGTTGMGTLQNTGEFTGSVAGCAGVESFTYRSVAKAQLEPPPPTGEGTTRIIASKATNDVVLSGVVRWDQVGPGGDYDIKFVCK
jgi:hypothetical protein